MVPISCDKCLLHRHADHPFHRIQKWDTERLHFSPIELIDLGFKLQLHHPGKSCKGYTASTSRVHRGRGGQVLYVAHVNGFHHISVEYCRCPSHPEHINQLLEARIFPGSVSRPETAYTIEVMEQFHMLNLDTGLSANGFYDSLIRLTNNAFRAEVKVSRSIACTPTRYTHLR